MTASHSAHAPPAPFQFRIATLLIAMALAGLVALGLRDPSPLWSDTIAMLNLLVMLTVILIAVYGSQRRRVMAVGFLVFSIGFLAYLAILTGNLNSGVHD